MEKPVEYNVQGAIIILTQAFTVLGSMSLNEQRDIYYRLSEKLPCDKKIYIKLHPDDELEYKEIFPTALIIKEKVPIELLSTCFSGKPKCVLTFSSTANLDSNKYLVVNLAENYKNLYDHNEEYNSFVKILSAENII
jgi:Glycosyltransferase family 52.